VVGGTLCKSFHIVVCGKRCPTRPYRVRCKVELGHLVFHVGHVTGQYEGTVVLVKHRACVARARLHYVEGEASLFVL
jgi:hypothetical protein